MWYGDEYAGLLKTIWGRKSVQLILDKTFDKNLKQRHDFAFLVEQFYYIFLNWDSLKFASQHLAKWIWLYTLWTIVLIGLGFWDPNNN